MSEATQDQAEKKVDAPATEAETTEVKVDQTPGTETIVSDPVDKPIAAPADWPEDWAAKMAGGDEKELATLSRFKSPVELAKAYREAQKKISSGQLKESNPYPADGTDEEKAEWRKANDLPENVEGYYKGLPDGLVVGDDDKPMVDSFLENVLNEGGTQAEANRAIAAYYDIQEKNAEARAMADNEAKITGEEDLRAELGAQFRPSIAALNSWLQTAPEDVRENLMNARGPDGTPIMSNANTLRWLMSVQQEINPAASVMPSGAASASGVADRIAEIEKMVADRSSEYWVGPNSSSLKAEYNKLLDAQEKMKSRA